MKKLVALLALVSTFAFAEASFDQIEGLIQQKNYAAAEAGLEVIIKNHPNSAKAFYAMAQAQAGLGNLEKAQKALNIATGLNPTLDFAPASSVQSLKQAITPQTAKIEAVEESHFWRNVILLMLLNAIGIYIIYNAYFRNDKDGGSGDTDPTSSTPPAGPAPVTPQSKVDRVNALPINNASTPSHTPTSSYTPAATTPAPTVVNNHYGSPNDGFVTGMLVGNMLGSSHHDHTTVIEREVIRETPSYAPAPTVAVRDLSWDAPAKSSSRSSSWDDDSSSSSTSKSSSWDDDSSSKKSSSWSSSSNDSSSSSWSSSSSDSSWSSSSSDSSWSSSSDSSSSSSWD